jgi:hypothetical protein
MSKRIGLLAIAIALLAPACASQSQFLAAKEPVAIQAALRRGQFDLNCPTATAEVLSANYVQAPGGRYYSGIDRAAYTVGVQGCDKRDSYVVICQDGTDTCFAAQPQGK